jgi:hypothetical protein
MSIIQDLQESSADYRLVGVITIGITTVPIIGFGYPERFGSDPASKELLNQYFSNHERSVVSFRYARDRSDRVIYHLPEKSLESFLDLPFEQDRTSISLFADTAQKQKDYLIALTLADKTYLCFYDLIQVFIDTERRLVERLEGRLTKYVVGKAVPLLRTIETLKSQAAPQRRIQIPDEELGIIYQVLAGNL